MCGICGEVSLSRVGSPKALGSQVRVARMVEALIHRGPDDHGLIELGVWLERVDLHRAPAGSESIGAVPGRN